MLVVGSLNYFYYTLACNAESVKMTKWLLIYSQTHVSTNRKEIPQLNLENPEDQLTEVEYKHIYVTI